MMLEKDGEDQLDRSCEKSRGDTWSQGGKKGIEHNLRRNCLLKQIIEGKTQRNCGKTRKKTSAVTG